MEKQKVEIEGLESRDDGDKAASPMAWGTFPSERTYPVPAIRTPARAHHFLASLAGHRICCSFHVPPPERFHESFCRWWEGGGACRKIPLSSFLGELMESCCIVNGSRLTTKGREQLKSHHSHPSVIVSAAVQRSLSGTAATTVLYAAPQPRPKLSFETLTIQMSRRPSQTTQIPAHRVHITSTTLRIRLSASMLRQEVQVVHVRKAFALRR